MNIPKPVMRGLLTIVMLGSVAAVLPGQFGQASADSGPMCTLGSSYVLRATRDDTSPPPTDPGYVTLSTTAAVKFHAYVSMSPTGTNTGTFQKATAAATNASPPGYPGRTLTFTVANDSTSAGTIAIGGKSAAAGSSNTYTAPVTATDYGGNLAQTTAKTTGTITTEFKYTPTGGALIDLVDTDNLSTTAPSP